MPLALVEEQAEGEVATEERCNDGEGDSFDKPDGADEIRWSGLRWGGLGHCINNEVGHGQGHCRR